MRTFENKLVKRLCMCADDTPLHMKIYSFHHSQMEIFQICGTDIPKSHGSSQKAACAGMWILITKKKKF